MKIIRIKQLRDYFDYISDIYGVDPLVTFKQKMKFSVYHFQGVSQGFPLSYLERVSHIDDHVTKTQRFYVIVVCGVAYVVEKCKIKLEYDQWQFADRVLTKDEFRSMFNTPSRYLLSFIDCIGVYNEKWVKYHKLLDSPIFIPVKHNKTRSENNYDIYFRSTTPLLRDLGFGRIKPALSMFLEIQQFLIGMKSCEPPVEISNQSLIEKHGFNKQSFRKDKSV